PWPHWPLRHAAAALAGAHFTPHPPQLLRSVPSVVSQPLAGFMSQSPYRLLHEPMPHMPPLQAGTPFATDGQTVPHVPQLLRSVAMLASQPSAELLSQSP